MSIEMTQDDIIRMAREAGDWNGQTAEFNDVGLERFAALVAAHEREACAKVCEDIRFHLHKGDFYAAAIRARSKDK